MLKINLVVTCLKVGGQEKIVAWLSRLLESKKYDVTIILLGFKEETILEVSPGVKLVYLDIDNKFGTIRWYQIQKQIKKFRYFKKSLIKNEPNLIISFGDKTNIEVLLACFFKNKIKFIVSEQSDLRMHKINFRLNLLRKFLYTKAHYVVVISEGLYKFCSSKYKYWNVKKISNPIDIIYPVKNLFEKPKFFNQKNIISLSRLIESKRVDLIIKVFSELSDDYPTWNLIIIGDGPCFFELKKLSQELRIDSRVHFVGQIFPPYDLLSLGDLFVTASAYESFGISIGEALALGLPAISFDVLSGPRDIITDNFNGFLIPDNNLVEFKKKIELLMNDNELREKFSRNAPLIQKKFSQQNIFSEWEKLIISSD
jgi:GalNAc-alpha-(1->4)-GalNAc-alpha-(1->3)-diNAcBac-PP-undecaprenol alpha-1,4-N-acetyl-D-galactosaminyltransferase